MAHVPVYGPRSALHGPFTGAWDIFRVQDDSEVVLIFTIQLYLHFFAFIVCFRAYLVCI